MLGSIHGESLDRKKKEKKGEGRKPRKGEEAISISVEMLSSSS
uniref:Uncharacterized protein n=1 Tax=Zea mays TaxID=4577 RepID=C4J474_MAIZE|nr:unknown [Zea mays]